MFQMPNRSGRPPFDHFESSRWLQVSSWWNYCSNIIFCVWISFYYLVLSFLLKQSKLTRQTQSFFTCCLSLDYNGEVQITRLDEPSKRMVMVLYKSSTVHKQLKKIKTNKGNRRETKFGLIQRTRSIPTIKKNPQLEGNQLQTNSTSNLNHHHASRLMNDSSHQNKHWPTIVHRHITYFWPILVLSFQHHQNRVVLGLDLCSVYLWGFFLSLGIWLIEATTYNVDYRIRCRHLGIWIEDSWVWFPSSISPFPTYSVLLPSCSPSPGLDKKVRIYNHWGSVFLY